MSLHDDRENVYEVASIPYQPAYKESLSTVRSQKGKQGAGSQRPGHEQRTPPMPKKKAIALVSKLKRWLVVSSLVSTGAFGGLILTHLPASAAATTQNGANKSTTTSSTSSQTTTSGEYESHSHHRHSDDNASSANNSSSGSYFQQQGGDQFGSSSSDQQPVTGSHAS